MCKNAGSNRKFNICCLDFVPLSVKGSDHVAVRQQGPEFGRCSIHPDAAAVPGIFEEHAAGTAQLPHGPTVGRFQSSVRRTSSGVDAIVAHFPWIFNAHVIGLVQCDQNVTSSHVHGNANENSNYFMKFQFKKKNVTIAGFELGCTDDGKSAIAAQEERDSRAASTKEPRRFIRIRCGWRKRLHCFPHRQETPNRRGRWAT